MKPEIIIIIIFFFYKILPLVPVLHPDVQAHILPFSLFKIPSTRKFSSGVFLQSFSM
jgi:hypothetical protein